MGPYRDNPVWQNLEFVKAGQVHNIGNIWMTGGIYTTTAVVERVVDALTEGQQSASETRTISHDMGETTITGTPQRVITMSQVSCGILLELGIEPVGADLWQKGSLRRILKIRFTGSSIFRALLKNGQM